MAIDKIPVGTLVQWYDSQRGWRYGRIKAISEQHKGRGKKRISLKWASVSCAGALKKILLSDLIKY